MALHYSLPNTVRNFYRNQAYNLTPLSTMWGQLNARLKPLEHYRQYGTEGINWGPQLCSHYAERHIPLGRLMKKIPVFCLITAEHISWQAWWNMIAITDFLVVYFASKAKDNWNRNQISFDLKRDTRQIICLCGKKLNWTRKIASAFRKGQASRHNEGRVKEQFTFDICPEKPTSENFLRVS